MDILTNTSWTPAMTIELLIPTIISVIHDGGAELDDSRVGKCYGFSEAKSAFDRLRRAHHW